MVFLVAVGSLVAVCAVLAAVLVIADRCLHDHGTCRVTLNDGERVLEVPRGGSLLSQLSAQRHFIPSACGGSGSCGLCRLKVSAGGGSLQATEAAHLTPAEIAAGLRLACQVRVRGDLAVTLPRALLAVREYRAQVVAIAPLTHDTRFLRLELLDPETIDFVPGAYVQLQTPAHPGISAPVYRAYSLAGDPADRHHIDLIIRHVPEGICTTWVFTQLKVGDTVTCNGPHGEFRLADTAAETIFVAGGSGMAPFRSILFEMRRTRNPRPTRYFFGAVTRRDLFCLDEMAQFERDLPDFRFIPALSRPASDDAWTGEVGLITDVVGRHYPDAAGREAYLCGSPGMIAACTKVLTAHGMAADRVHVDTFS